MSKQFELEKLYAKLGKAYYEGKFEDPLPELLPLFDQITKTLKQEERTEYRKICPNCGLPVERDSAFCGNCGHKLG